MKTYILSTILLFMACSVTAQTSSQPINKFTDPVLRDIYTKGNARQATGLIEYLGHSNPTYRSEAVLFFASFHDTTSLPALYPLLQDQNVTVRQHTAFAIGQMRKSSSIHALIHQFQRETDAVVRRYILEAMGQSANFEGLQFLEKVVATDSITQVGLAWAFNRATKNKIFSSVGSDRMASFLAFEYPDEARQAAAYYFSQLDSVGGYEQTMIHTAMHDPNIDVRLGVLRGLRKVQAPEAREALVQLIRQSSDYRLRVDAIQAARQFKHAEVAKVIWERALQDPHISVRIAAAEALPMQAGPGDLVRLLDGMGASKSMRLKQLFLHAANQLMPNDDRVLQATRQLFDQKMHHLERQEVLQILGTQPHNWRYLSAAVVAPQYVEIKSMLLSTLRRVRQNNRFPVQDESAYNQMMVQWAQSEDFDRVSESVRFLATKENFKEVVARSIEKWNKSEDSNKGVLLEKLTQSLSQPRASQQQSAAAPTYRDFDWSAIEKIPVDQQVRIKTTKGSFILQMQVEEAPFTVAHFLELAEKGAFTGLAFYRVIPNFVNQTGGTPHAAFEQLANLLIRSEFKPRPHRYMTVNFGSHGPDTESSHWSIMLRSTPWNDYNYTVFAQVVAGEEIVHQLELGDEITKIELL
jgi:cyclophilin family peptidyl-prolyl cis-trans isomerase/HEAT repeat protein